MVAKPKMRCADGAHNFERYAGNNLILCTRCGQGECSVPFQSDTMPGEHSFRHETIDGRLACLCGAVVKNARAAKRAQTERFAKHPSLRKFTVNKAQ